VVTEREVVEGEHLALVVRHLPAGLDDLVPGLERRPYARVGHDVIPVRQNAGVQLVADPINLALPGPRIGRRRLVDVVYVAADAIAQVHERQLVALYEVGEA
jgi:hypothetical protein